MDDLISRQAAIDALGEEPEVWVGADDEVAARGQWRIDKAAIEAVPTVGCEYWDTESNYCALYRPVAVPTAEKKGKWIDYCGGVKCDQCGFECDDTYYLGEANYCPNCGVKMTEENDEADKREE